LCSCLDATAEATCGCRASGYDPRVAGRAVLFDVDGTLLDVLANQRRVWEVWADRFALDGDVVSACALRTTPRQTFAQVAPDRDPDECLAVLHELEDQDARAGSYAAFAGARKLLRRLPPDAWAVVTSNYAHRVAMRFERLGLPRPRVVIDAEAAVRRRGGHSGRSGRRPGERDELGWEVCRAAVEVAVEILGERIVSAYAIGSLAHGGFSAPVSDIDVALLVDACDQNVPAVVEGVADRTRERLGTDMAERLSVSYGDWPTFDQPHPWARLGAIDRLDLIHHGVLVCGIDHRRRFGREPQRAELVATTAAFLANKPLAPQEPAALVAQGPRALTKAVLSPVRFLYTYATGRAGSNADAARWYSDSRRPAAPLVRAALRWRTGVVPRAEAVALVDAHLAGLQSECENAFGAL
jgi:hypothetical protein